MSSFKEFLEDYEGKEFEENNRFLKRLKDGKISQDEMYPHESRFIKLKKPVAISSSCNIWGLVPFNGSTMVYLVPRDDKKSFDNIHENRGFNSRAIDKMIDLTKETGRIQFITGSPTLYKNLEFLEPLFYELKPPFAGRSCLRSIIEPEILKKYEVEFDTLAGFGFTKLIYDISYSSGITNETYLKKRLFDYASDYIQFKVLGYENLAEEIGDLMVMNPSEALEYFNTLGNIIAVPPFDPLKSIHNFNRDRLTKADELVKPYGIELYKNTPYEIGRFLLNKIVLYPDTFDGCMKVIQEYDDNELYKVLGALDEGAKRNDINIIEDKKVDVSEILGNVWKDADKIKIGSEGISFGVSLNIGLIGELASGLPGIGLMAGLGFQAIDRFWGVKSESLSEKIAKFVSPNYLITIYDFKKKHALTK